MRNKLIGYTTGVYDLFHIGHLRLLKKAKLHCDYLIVGVSSDELVHSYKGKKPVIPLEHRLEIVNALKFVDEVVIQSHRDKFRQFEEYGYDVLFVGDDWKGHPLWVELEEKLKGDGAMIKYFPYTRSVSSTKFTEILQGIYDDEKSL
jgi:glycerol-3-phosphate cytidylyltransferase